MKTFAVWMLCKTKKKNTFVTEINQRGVGR
jgi:hypothetical protein